jgi:cytochrome c553
MIGETRMRMIAPLVGLLALLAGSAPSGQPAPPPPPFLARCAACHGDEGRGTANGPGLVMNSRVAVQTIEQLSGYLQRGNPGAGMPAFADLPADDLLALARYLRRINVETIIPPPAVGRAEKTAWGPPRPGDWRTYNGSDSANRYSPLTEITRANVGALKVKGCTRWRISDSRSPRSPPTACST